MRDEDEGDALFRLQVLDHLIRIRGGNDLLEVDAAIGDELGKTIDDDPRGDDRREFIEWVLQASDVSDEEKMALIDELNHTESIDGILVQLPVPDQINPEAIIQAIDPAKDVDGLLMAGRNISGDFIAHSSYRVTGNAVPMGEAAGKVAARAAAANRLPQDVSYRPDA